MTISKTYLTLLINLILAFIGTIIAYFTNLLIIIPLIFGLGVPLINIERPLIQKLGLSLVIALVSTVIFVVTIYAAISFDLDKYILPGIIVGLSGVAILGINGFLIKTIEFDIKTISLTFLLSGISLPTWVLLTENLFPATFTNIEFVRQFGVMLFWMTLTTIGICFSLNSKQQLTGNELI